MSLNDDTLNTLQDTDGITEPADITTTGDAPMIVTATPGEEADEENLLAHIEDYELWVKTVEDEHTQLHSLDKVAQLVLGAESISRADVERILGSVNNTGFQERLEENVSSIAGFTSSATQTNLQETQQFLKNEVQAQQQAATQSFMRQVTVSQLEEAVLMSERVQAFLVQFEATVQTLTLDAVEALKQANLSQNYLAYVKTQETVNGVLEEKVDLVDLRQLGFSNYAVDEALLKLIGMTRPQAEAIRQLFQDPDLSLLLTPIYDTRYVHREGIADRLSTIMLLSRDEHRMEPLGYPTYMKLLALMASGDPLNAISCFVRHLEETRNDLLMVANRFKADPEALQTPSNEELQLIQSALLTYASNLSILRIVMRKGEHLFNHIALLMALFKKIL